ncbi:hypothetical protein BASA81_003583 [Batrachochytrium salamandrivorans]|nr:hypothetical protein BASA81_003583 [Batrachochytrium salamandrivorans]
MSSAGIACGFAGTFDGECLNQFKYQDSLVPIIDYDDDGGRRHTLEIVPENRRIDFAISDYPLGLPGLVSFPVVYFWGGAHLQPPRLVVRSDEDQTVLEFKRALSGFEAGFRTQIGTAAVGSNVWKGTQDFTYAIGDVGVQRAVTHFPGAIGFDRIHSNLQLGTPQAELLYEDGSGKTLKGTTESLETAGVEIADEVGANATKLTLDLIGVTGKRSWPISMVSYLSFTVDGYATSECAEQRNSFLSFVWYIYNNSASSLFVDGLGALPYKGTQKLWGFAQDQVYCQGKLVYQKPAALRQVYFVADEAFHHMLSVFGKRLEVIHPFNLQIHPIDPHQEINRKFLCISNLTCSAETNYGLIVLADEALTAEVVADDAATDVYSLVSLPFFAVSSGFIVNLCPADKDVACAYRYNTPLVLDIATAAKMLDLEIEWWNDTAITRLNPDKLLPQQRINVYAGSRNSSFHRNFVNHVRSAYDASFQYSGGGDGRGTYLEAWMDVSLTPFSFSFVVFNGTVVEGVEKVSLINRQGVAIAASPATIEACALDTFDAKAGYFSVQDSRSSECYPLVNTYNVFLKNILPRGFTVQVTNTMLSQTQRLSAEVQSPVEVNEMGTLTDLVLQDGTDMWDRNVAVLESMVYVSGLSILLVDHELNLIPAPVIYTMYAIMILELVFYAVLAGWVCRNRRRKLVNNSSPTFMYQVLFGAGIMSLTIVPLSVQDSYLVPRAVTAAKLAIKTNPYLDVACLLDPILFSFGFFIAFSALFLKAWRLIRIFNNRRLRNLYVKDRELLAYQVLVLVLVAALNAIWLGLEPMVWRRTPAFYNANKLVVNSNGMCITTGSSLTMLPMVLALVGFLVVGNFLSYLGRRIPTEFNESKWTAMTMVIAMEAFLIGLPILALAGNLPVGGYVVKCLVSLLISGSMVGLIFVPKLMLAYGWGAVEGEDSNPWRFAKDGSDSTGKKAPTSPPHSKQQPGGFYPALNGGSSLQNFSNSSFNRMGSHNNQYPRAVTLDNTTKSELLSAILKDDPTRRKFRRYLQTLKQEENVRFWDAALLIASEPDGHKRYVGSRAMIQTFCLPNAPFEVNLSSRTRQDLLDAFHNNQRDKLEHPEQLFKQATKELFEDLKQSDGFRQYLEADTFSVAQLGV